MVYVPGQPLIDKATKTRSKRRLALDTRSVELLRAHRGRAEQVARELGTMLPMNAYVFGCEPDGSQPMHPTHMTHQFVALARSLGVHWHAGPHMTLGTYAHFQPAQDRAAADLLATLCDGRQ